MTLNRLSWKCNRLKSRVAPNFTIDFNVFKEIVRQIIYSQLGLKKAYLLRFRPNTTRSERATAGFVIR